MQTHPVRNLLFEDSDLSSYKWETRNNKKKCTLCGRSFRARTKFVYFCKSCKSESDLYKFSDWFSK